MTTPAPPDMAVILARIQDQLDDLAAAVEALHRRLTALEQRHAAAEPRPRPAPPR